MPTILLIYSLKKLLDKNLIKISIYIMEQSNSNSDSDLLINKRIPKIIFKIKKYYIIYIQNRKSIDFDILKTAAKNILIYEIFNKESWD